MKWIIGLLFVVLAGCVSQEELAMQRYYEEQQYGFPIVLEKFFTLDEVETPA